MRHRGAGRLLVLELVFAGHVETAGRHTGHPHTVGDLAVPFGMWPVKLEAVGLVADLHGTGSDPEPSPQRAMLIGEMQRRGVENPNQLLATRNWSMVIVRGYLRPGVQKGDPFDVELRVTDRSETTSLRGGLLFDTRMSDGEAIGGRWFNGSVRGLAQGPVLVDPSATTNTTRCSCAAAWCWAAA